MPSWILKAVVQKGISFLPLSQRINYFFQKHITKGVQLSDLYFEDRLQHCRDHFRNFRKHNSRPDFSHLELGTGWYPVVPAGMFLYGAGSITTVDLNRLSSPDFTRATLRKFLEYHRTGRLEKLLPGILPERLKIVLEEAEKPSGDFFDLLERHHIVYMVMDVCKLPVPDGSFDLITSNNTLEHIYPDVLEDILVKLRRLVRVGGVMSHSIDLSDHFAHLDPSITVYNFLKFSDATWALINNSVQPMNRLRIYDYRAVFQRAGIPVTEEIIREPDMQAFARVKLHRKFLSRPSTENAVSHATIVSKVGV